MTTTPKALQVKNRGALLLVGTTKGAFLLSADGKRRSWQVSGPHFPGSEVHALVYDDRGGRRRILAGVHSPFYGSGLRTSDDFGGRWTNPKEASVRFPAVTKTSLKKIWQITLGTETNTLYCGVEPAALFESRDAGESWSLVRGLFDHPHRPRWQAGGGGLCLHTILPHPTDPRRMHVAISTGGVYQTDDGGASWTARNKGVRADFLPKKHPEFGQCVHKIARHPSRPETIFLQNHGGLYRSDDGGNRWQDIADGVPSDFGFAMDVHPREPETVYIVPLATDGRWVPEGKLRVYRTRRKGRSWAPLSKGLPQEDAYETVLRDGLATDALEPAGVYFGTRSGKLFGSATEGRSWKLIVDGLPPIACVKAAVVQSTPRRRARA